MRVARCARTELGTEHHSGSHHHHSLMAPSSLGKEPRRSQPALNVEVVKQYPGLQIK